MIHLVPRYHWEYRLRDALRGGLAALKPGVGAATIRVDGVGDCYAVRSGRTALVLALKSLHLPPASHVAVPLYCCPVVFDAVLAAGCRPAFIDVDEASYCLSAADLRSKIESVSAIVAVHMFGNLCDFDALRSVAGGRPVVEDCAQAIGSVSRGRPAGTFGDVAFFSFRCGKYVSAGEGGAVYSAHSPYRERLSRLLAALPKERAAAEVVHVVSTLAKAALYNRPLYGLIGYRLGHLLDRRMNLSSKRGVTLGTIRKSDLSIARRRLAGIGVQVDRQRRHALYYDRHLPPGLRLAPAAHDGSRPNSYQYPVRFRSEAERDAMARLLLAKGVDSARYLHDIEGIARRHFGYRADCPVAERLAKTTLIIPNSYSLDPATVRHIADAVNSTWQGVANRGSRHDGCSESPAAAVTTG